MADNSTEAILAAIGDLRADSTSRFDKMDSRLDNMERTDNIIQGEVRLLGSRVGQLETRMSRMDSEHAATKRQSVEGDEAQGAALVSAMKIHGDALAAVAKKVDDIADRPDAADKIIEEVKSAAKTPTGQKVIGGVVSLLLLVIALLGAKLQSQLDHIEKQQDMQQQGGAK